tara:strand:+ start:836 stop:2155 length:1320 start_codon:yes stop_codon:yes gene_type:complete
MSFLENSKNLSGIKLRNLIKSNKINKINFCNHLINFTKKINKEFKAFKKFSDQAIKDQFQNKKNKKEPLYCIPIGVKDIFNTYDYPNSFGSNIYEKYLPGNDARVIFDIRDKGGIILGKTYASEFAVHNPTPTLHPIDKKLSPGTSSAGSAVAVATKMVPIALGSQTAGSIIRPASYCGVFGFKPTFGTIARTGVLKTADTLDTIGFFSNHLDDLKLIFNSVRHKGKNYPHILKKFLTKKINFTKTSITIAKIIGPKSKNINSELNIEYEKIIKKLSEIKNIKIVEYNLPKIFDEAHYYHNIIYSKSLSYHLQKEFSNNSEKFSHSLKKMILDGQKISNSKYDEALDYQYKIIDFFEKKLKKIDFLIDLSTFTTAPKFGMNDVVDHNLIWTMAHIPALSIPFVDTNSRLPFGLLLTSKKFHDLKLLDFAKFIKNKLENE